VKKTEKKKVKVKVKVKKKLKKTQLILKHPDPIISTPISNKNIES